MKGLFFSITKTDCKEISSSFNENGLLEIITPKDCLNQKIIEYLQGLDIDAILKEQKKVKEAFRKKITKLIKKYAEELGIPFSINLSFLSKTKYICNGKAEINGIVFSGRVSLMTPLQFCPDDIVEKIVRYAVYKVAIQYENLCHNITSFSIGTIDMMSGEEESIDRIAISGSKYRIPLKSSEEKQIQSDYDNAFIQYRKEMEKQQIYYL